MKKGLLLSVASLVVCLLILEGGLRILYFRMNRTVEDAHFGTVYRHFMFIGNSFIPNAGGSWQAIDSMKINSFGFRGPEIDVEKPPNIYRIVTLGGSTSHSANYPRKLEGYLNKNSLTKKKIQVVNAAVPAWSTSHSIVQLVTRAIHLKADMFVVYHAINDIDMYPAKWLKELPQIDFARHGFLERNSLLYNFVVGALEKINNQWEFQKWNKQLKQNKIDEQPRSVFDVSMFKANIKSFSALAKYHNIKLVLVTMPLRNNPSLSEIENARLAGFAYRYRYPSSIAKVDAMNQASREVAESDGHILVDAANSDIQGNKEMFIDLCHFSEKGAQALATFIGQAITLHIE